MLNSNLFWFLNYINCCWSLIFRNGRRDLANYRGTSSSNFLELTICMVSLIVLESWQLQRDLHAKLSIAYASMVVNLCQVVYNINQFKVNRKRQIGYIQTVPKFQNPGSNPTFSRERHLVSFRFENRLPVPERRNCEQQTCISPEPGVKAKWKWGRVGWMPPDHRDGLLSF